MLLALLIIDSLAHRLVHLPSKPQSLPSVFVIRANAQKVTASRNSIEMEAQINKKNIARPGPK